MSPHSSNERMVVEKGQEVIISYADTLRNVSTNRDLLSSMEKRTVSPFPRIGSMPVFVSSKKALEEAVVVEGRRREERYP